MQVKRFVAADMRRALELVRLEMGPEAIILSNRRTKNGVEVLTTVEDVTGKENSTNSYSDETSFGDVEAGPLLSDGAWRDRHGVERALSERVQDERTQNQKSQNQNAGITPVKTVTPAKNSGQLAEEIERARQRMIADRKAKAPLPKTREPVNSDKLFYSKKEVIEKEGSHSEEENNGTENEIESLKLQIKEVRNLLEGVLESRTSKEPEHVGNLNSIHQMALDSRKSSTLEALVNRLEMLGLPRGEASSVIAKVGPGNNAEELWNRALALLARRIPVVKQDLVASGGVYAFVGPSGVGKTTTIAKLATRYVLEQRQCVGSWEGKRKSVALLTVDSYGIAANEQLRSLGRILDVPVKIVDPPDLGIALEELRDYPLVLVDTPGFRHGDPQLQQQLSSLQSTQGVTTLLVLACNSQVQMLKASVHAYRTAGLRACVLTKLDETASLGEALGLTIQERLAVAYTTNGQKIPEDIDVGRGPALVSKTLAISKDFSANHQPLHG